MSAEPIRIQGDPPPAVQCWKERFDHRRDAARVAKRLGNAREYRCDDCGGWHLTSKPKRRGKPW